VAVGTLSGGIAAWLADDPALPAALSDGAGGVKLRVGDEPSTFAMPWVRLSFPGGRGSLHSDRFYAEEVVILLQVYGVGEDATRQLAEWANDRLLSSHDQIPVGPNGVTLTPDGVVQLARDPELSPRGADVFRWDLRYKTTIGRQLPA
jgi:hypothetical protein